MKFYCLTVKESPWRNDAVAERFKAAGLDVEFFYGVHGQTVGIMPTMTIWDAPPGEHGRRNQHPYRVNPGHVSLTLNKVMLYQRILDRADDVVLIFENDVVLADNFLLELAKSMAALPDDWEACHVGYCCTEGKPHQYINDRISTVFWPMCCHAMLWKRSALQKVIDGFKRNSWGNNSDIILQRVIYPTMKHYVFSQALASQEQSLSEAGSTVTWESIQGWFDWQVLIDEQLTSFDGHKAVVVEVGSWLGRSTAYTAEEIKRRLLGETVKFYAVDTWRGNADEPDMQAMIADHKGDLFPAFQANMLRCGVSDYVIPMRMTSVEAAATFKDGECSFVFLDAGHSYEDVKADLNAWYDKVHYNSCMAGHDLARTGVRKAVTEFCEQKGIKFREWGECWIVNHCHRTGA
jgi:GR25 family glycosyltransferase involved in LPS biosynthesis